MVALNKDILLSKLSDAGVKIEWTSEGTRREQASGISRADVPAISHRQC
jgi:hypothetical protein